MRNLGKLALWFGFSSLNIALSVLSILTYLSRALFYVLIPKYHM